MGLDIYFYRRNNNINFDEFENQNKELHKSLDQAWKIEDEDIRTAEVKRLETEINDFSERNEVEIAYFRKVNSIIDFFNVVENCEDVLVTKAQLEDYIEAANKVLSVWDEMLMEKVDEKEMIEKITPIAEDNLPATHGFFFGSYVYDKWYISDIRDASAKFKRIIEETDWDNEYVVVHAWW